MERDERIEQVLDGYFDVRTARVVERVLSLLDGDEVEDDDAVDALFDRFVAALERRYGRSDPGWAASARDVVRAEWDAQVDRERSFRRTFETD